MVNRVKQALDVICLGRASTVTETEMSNHFRTKPVADIKVQTVLAHTNFIVLTAEIVG